MRKGPPRFRFLDKGACGCGGGDDVSDNGSGVPPPFGLVARVLVLVVEDEDAGSGILFLVFAGDAERRLELLLVIAVTWGRPPLLAFCSACRSRTDWERTLGDIVWLDLV
jgi:hypothetical protein